MELAHYAEKVGDTQLFLHLLNFRVLPLKGLVPQLNRRHTTTVINIHTYVYIYMCGYVYMGVYIFIYIYI